MGFLLGECTESFRGVTRRARFIERHNSEVGRGANNLGETNGSKGTRFDLSEKGRRAAEDVIEVFVADCVSSIPRGATLRVLDRKGGRRILHGDKDVTRLARRITYFSVQQNLDELAWTANPLELVRTIALSLYGDEGALDCAETY